MIRTNFLLAIISFFIVGISVAQSDIPKNKLGISTGYNWGAYKNLTLSPISIYEYGSPHYAIKYSRYTKKNKLVTLGIQHWGSELKSERIPSLNLAYSGDRISLNCLYLLSHSDKWTTRLGYFTQLIAGSFGDEVVAFEVQQKFALTGRMDYQIDDKQHISSQLSAPFLLFVVGNLDFDFYFPHKHQGYILQLDYHYVLSHRFDIAVQFLSRYDRVESTNVYRELHHQTILGIDYKF